MRARDFLPEITDQHEASGFVVIDGYVFRDNNPGSRERGQYGRYTIKDPNYQADPAERGMGWRFQRPDTVSFGTLGEIRRWLKTQPRKSAEERQRVHDKYRARETEFQDMREQAEDHGPDMATSLRRLGKFYPGQDPLAELVPERASARYALHPDKWQSTFYSLTNKDPDKLRYYGPTKIAIPPGTLVGDMAIANQFYRAKTAEEKQRYAELYRASLQPNAVDVSRYRMPELLMPRQEVSE